MQCTIYHFNKHLKIKTSSKTLVNNLTPILAYLGFQCEHGIMKPSWIFMPENQNHFHYDPASVTNSINSDLLSSNPLLKDPLEDFWVEVKER